ncbi:MAG: Shikimate dehydrogenase (NADP(+)) [Opitutia bacterium UBA7350]|nr:MAG: Shikimate dehydrogenase (NADP(+)) [Opitutae bacterium UBA7350]
MEWNLRPIPEPSPMDTHKTYTLEDLDRLEFHGTPLAVLGDPVEHSLSPVMHNTAISKLAQTDQHFKDWAYYRFTVPAVELSSALQGFYSKGFEGVNLTVPHKVLALKTVTDLSGDAMAMGAVNTLKRGDDGWLGYNTDGYGLERGLLATLGQSLKGSVVMLAGSGGAARAAAVQCLLSGCKKLYLGNRTPERLGELREILAALGKLMEVEVFSLAALPEDLPKVGIFINATSLGLRGDDPSPIEVQALPSDWVAYDMVYNPPQTQLLTAAASRGMKCANGLSMLVYQGARALEIWTGQTVDATVMRNAAEAALAKKERESSDA